MSSVQFKAIVVSILGVALMTLSSCKREERSFRVAPPAASTVAVVRTTDFRAGGRVPIQPVNNAYEENAYAMSEGQRLYSQFNCVGYHFHGGGGIGPPLMDETWIYGSDPDQVFSTIVQGRPNGMPSYRGKIPDYQIWQIVAYVRSMSGLVNKTAAPGRSDEMTSTTPPNSVPTTRPVQSFLPKSAEMPG